MNCWFFPVNDTLFRLDDAISAGHGTVDVRCSAAFAVGDRIYVYRKKPVNRILYEMEAVKTAIPMDESTDKLAFWTDQGAYYSGLMTSNYCRLRIIRTVDDDNLTGENLISHGLRNLLSVDILPQDVIAYILHPATDNTYGVDYPEKNDFYEGAMMTVEVNKYERSQSARDECIAKKGCRCIVCGLDFEEKYGSIGRHFIHVHHLVPISSIGKEYKLDVEKDLVPVCPNCHYMLHKKQDGVFTPEELKKILKEVKESHSLNGLQH